MSKALVKRILNAREEVTTATDGTWHGWTETELRLAEYAAELRAENARLRQILVDTCNATRGECTADVSVGFLAHLPGEVAMTVAENASLTAELAAARDALRIAVANYMRSEGCSCCRDYDAHERHEAELARLLDVPAYADNSGFDFRKFAND